MQLVESILTYQNLNPVKGYWKNIRKNASGEFSKLYQAQGMPGKDQEAWHYTSLKKFPERLLLPALDRSSKNSFVNLLNETASTEFFNLVYVNGQIHPDFTDPELLEAIEFSYEKIKNSDLKENSDIEMYLVGQKCPRNLFKEIQQYRKKAAEFNQDSMEALNGAFADYGMILRISKNVKFEKPIQILNIKTHSTALYPRNVIFLEEGAQVNIIESFVSECGQGVVETWQNNHTEIVLKKGSHCDYVRWQAEDQKATHVGSTRFYLDRDSVLKSLVVSAGSKLTRHNLQVHLVGENAFAQINGISLSDGNQHVDNRTLIDHSVGNCQTSQLYKSILGGESKSIFSGRVHIKKDAQKASSEQLNQNLLLSEKAEANSKPELGIYADDVKASHGSTIGQISKEEVFYLMSRAISKDEALTMLSLAYIQELVDRIEVPSMKDWLSEGVQKYFRKMQSQSSSESEA